MWMADPFLLLAEERQRDLFEDARRYALVREAGAGRRDVRTRAIAAWLGRALGIRPRRAPIRTARSGHAPGVQDAAHRDEPGRRPAA